MSLNRSVIKVEGLSKQYRLGLVGTGTLSHDLNRWWASFRGKEDPYLKIGEVNKRNKLGESDYVWALKNINFEVGQGEVLGIIGKNGAGKSTLLKILSRVTGPSAGTLKVKGRIASLLEVGTGFHPELTGKENIFLNGAILGMSKSEIRNKLDEIVEFSGVERYIDTPVKRYSSGMYVRLAFAVAAHLEPEILVIDEVLAVGDVEFQKKCLGKMKDVAREGRTVLFVSHNMDAILNLCSRLLVLKDGTTSFEGDVQDGIDHYLNTEEQFEGFADLTETKSDRWNQPKSYSKLISVKTMNKDFVTKSAFSMGETILVEIEFEIKEDIQNIEIGLFFQDYRDISNGITLSTSEGFKDFVVGRQKVRVEIPNINLMATEYLLGVLISKKGEVDDAKEKALKVNILSSNFTGHPASFDYEKYKGYRTLLRGKWTTLN